MHPCKILYVASGLGVGGAETMLLQLARGLGERGHEQYVISMTGIGPIGLMLQDLGVSVVGLNMQSSFGFASGLWKLRRAVAATAPDIIQGWMYHGNLAALFAHSTCLGRRRRRLYWGLRATIVTDGRYDRMLGWSARLSGIPKAIIANSKAGMIEHVARGFHARRFEVIPNGIDTERFRPNAYARARLRAAWGVGEDDVVLIHVARVDVMKDHTSFLRAVEALPHVRAILVGLGTEQLTLPPNARALGVRDDVDQLYAAADIVVSSSAYGEGFSNVVAEGMSTGLTPVTTDVGDARAIIGEVGQVVPPCDAGALARALGDMAMLSRRARENLGQRARQRIISEFSIEKAVSRFERLYCGTEETGISAKRMERDAGSRT